MHVRDRQLGFIYMPIASPEIESAVNQGSLRLKVYLEYLDGSIAKPTDVALQPLATVVSRLFFFLGYDNPNLSAFLLVVYVRKSKRKEYI